MKWIKTWDSLFEGYLDDPEYKEISTQDFLRISYGTSEVVVDINPTIFNRITDRTDNVVSTIKLFSKRKEKSIRISNTDEHWTVYIIELEDEWFIVVDNTDYIFKCDGTTGLFKCLKDRNIIK
jgi:hypothetical protein